ncbi:MAG: UDP-3-O-[3-hydroxymyristoyl] N-acetylglucosamine deacetylase [Candidatus Puniceispirillum sp.]|nr:UDP-3-O-[3-hydroxymyristoyl] N-acetylglucosamine deacetylase [Candidatus Puniceispirillum sp.]
MVIAGRETRDFLNQEGIPCQTTLQKSGSVEGVGIHSGAPVQVTFHPASENTGIVFRRSDVAQEAGDIPALWHLVNDTRMSTGLVNAQGTGISMVEHCMAAVMGLEIDNLVIEVSGPEMPVLDGSSAPYVKVLQGCVLQSQQAHRRFLKVLQEVEVRRDDAYVRLSPASQLTLDFSIDFFGGREGLAPQTHHFAWTPGGFLREIACARTFGFYEDALKLQAAGLAKGASLDNTLVYKEGLVMNEGGERVSQESVRHKILDAVGDLGLAGSPIIGAYTSHNGGHAMNNALLHALFESEENYTYDAATKAPYSTWQPFAAIAI